jgi:hypothetical protein
MVSIQTKVFKKEKGLNGATGESTEARALWLHEGGWPHVERSVRQKDLQMSFSGSAQLRCSRSHWIPQARLNYKLMADFGRQLHNGV